MGKTLLHKTWEAHSVRQLASGQTQLFIGLHLVHEVTSPWLFKCCASAEQKCVFPSESAFAT